MTPEELRAVGRLGARVVSGTASHIEQVHKAIASRAFRSTGTAGAPAQETHDAIAKAVYGGVRMAGRSTGLALAEVVSLLTASRSAGPLGSSPATSYLGWALAQVPETRAYASLVNVRSDGIKDLRFGYVVDEDWAGCDADRCLQNHRTAVPLLATANHYPISAAVAGDARHPLARLVGDLLVQPGSARGRRLFDIPLDNIRHYEGLHHLSLLNHPAVYKAMHDWLEAS